MTCYIASIFVEIVRITRIFDTATDNATDMVTGIVSGIPNLSILLPVGRD